MGHKIERFKLRISSLVHRMFPGKYCWADCVSFAYAKDRWNPFKIDTAKGCEQESKEHPHKQCYCGGWSEGQCWDKLPKKERDRINKESKEWYDNQKEELLPF